MKKKIFLIALLTCIISALIIYTFFSTETCVKLNNKSISSITLIKSYSEDLDTVNVNVPSNKEICIGNWESLFGKLHNGGLAAINEKYDLLKVIMSDKSEINLLNVTPEYEISGAENQYIYRVE